MHALGRRIVFLAALAAAGCGGGGESVPDGGGDGGGAVADGDIAPHTVVKLSLGDKTAVPLDEAAERLERLRLKRDVPATAGEPVPFQIQGEVTELIRVRGCRCHDR